MIHDIKQLSGFQSEAKILGENLICFVVLPKHICAYCKNDVKGSGLGQLFTV